MNEDEKNSSSESYMGNTSLFREQSQYSIGREKENASKITLLAYPKGIQCLLIGSLSNNHSKTFSRNTSGSFNQNPYSYGENLLELDEAQTTSTLINRMWQQSLKDSYRKNAKGLLMLSTLGSLHRFSAGVSVSYREQERSEQTQSDTRFFLRWLTNPNMCRPLQKWLAENFRSNMIGNPRHISFLFPINWVMKPKSRDGLYMI